MTKKKIATPLSRKAVLVSVNISQWTGRKFDKRVTQEAHKKYSANDDAGRYNKKLLAGEHLAELSGLRAKARHLHYKLTRPWADDGPRILPNVLFSKFSEEFRVIKRDFGAAADRFAANYPAFVKERQQELNGMFNAEDYPAPNQIRSKFQIDLTVLPLPDADDFRADLDEETIADIKDELRATSKQVLSKAMEHTAQQIIETVGHMAEKLKQYKTGEPGEHVFRDSLVSNVRDLAELLPSFNLTEDPKLTKIANRILKELCTEDAAVLRSNDDVRKTVQKSADQIVSEVGSLFA